MSNQILSFGHAYFFPKLGQFYAINNSDACVLIDDSVFRKSSLYSWWHRRVILEKQQGNDVSIILPIEFTDYDPTHIIKLHRAIQYKDNHLMKISRTYKKAPQFERVMPFINYLYDELEKYDSMIECNSFLIYAICTFIGIKNSVDKIIFTSMHLNRNKENRTTNFKSFVAKFKPDEIMLSNGLEKVLRKSDNERFLDGITLDRVDYSKMFPPHNSILDILFNYSALDIKELLTKKA